MKLCYSLRPNGFGSTGGFVGSSWKPFEESAYSAWAKTPSFASIQSFTGNSNILSFISLTEIWERKERMNKNWVEKNSVATKPCKNEKGIEQSFLTFVQETLQWKLLNSTFVWYVYFAVQCCFNFPFWEQLVVLGGCVLFICHHFGVVLTFSAVLTV